MTKEELENKKLALEVIKLSTPWYKNIEFWKVSIPTIAILISLYFTFGRGLIDSERSKLEIQKEQLRLDITRFEMKSEALSLKIEAKDSIRTALEKQILQLLIQKDELKDSTNLFNLKLRESETKLNESHKERSKDIKYYHDELSKEYEAEKGRLRELEILKSKLNEQVVYNEIANAEIDFLTQRVQLSESEKRELKLLKLTTSIKEYEKLINSYEKSGKDLKKKYEKEFERINKLTPDELAKEFELELLKIDNSPFEK